MSYISKGLLPYRGLGSGIQRALAEWSSVSFLNDREACLFTAVIQRAAPVNAPVKMSHLQVEIVRLVGETPTISMDMLAKRLKKNRATIMRNIGKLKKAGILKRLGADKGGSWELQQKIQNDVS